MDIYIYIFKIEVLNLNSDGKGRKYQIKTIAFKGYFYRMYST